MADSLTLADVERVAELAHLELTDDEKHLFLVQLNEILGYARQIQALDTTGVPPTAHVLSQHTADRADITRPSLATADVIAAAPDAETEAGLFKVPRVIASTDVTE
jgi:aspartyl-tRNA(Asn)/glutamyl-tRNA(Gln) amidotransferase subunit C